MIILNSNITEQTIKVIPRWFPKGTVTLRIKDIYTDVDETISATYTKGDDDMLHLSFTFPFENDHTYKVLLKDIVQDTVYRGMIFGSSTIHPQTFTAASYVSWS
tara:strand:+ start:90 stop:401 length:312 start_codon:yes stop_codon:yes gene_type:complete